MPRTLKLEEKICYSDLLSALRGLALENDMTCEPGETSNGKAYFVLKGEGEEFGTFYPLGEYTRPEERYIPAEQDPNKQNIQGVEIYSMRSLEEMKRREEKAESLLMEKLKSL